MQRGYCDHIAARTTFGDAGSSSRRLDWYGESPEVAAVRETLEETGLETEIIQCLGWFFSRNFSGWPGPIISFMYATRVIGGELRGSAEGEARIHPIEAFPDIVCPERKGCHGD